MDIVIEQLQYTQTSSKFQKEILFSLSSITEPLPSLTTAGLKTQPKPFQSGVTFDLQPKKNFQKSTKMSFYENSDAKSGFSNSVVRKNAQMLTGKPTTPGNLIKMPDFNYDAPSNPREPKNFTSRKVIRSPKPESRRFFAGNQSPPKAARDLPLEVQISTKNVADIKTIKNQIKMNTKNFDFDRIQEHNTSRKATHLVMVKVPGGFGEESAAGIRVPFGVPSGRSPRGKATEQNKARFISELEPI